MFRIAVDALGGDFAPQSILEGVRTAVSERGNGEIEATLFGPDALLSKVAGGRLPTGVKIFNIPEKPLPEGGDSSSVAEDAESAIRIAMKMHSAGKFDAVISAGSTGAQVLASLYELGRCPGITRPALGALLPTAGGECFMLDAGASLAATPHHLVQFAAMGHVYAREMMGIDAPKIGLLNVGKELSSGYRQAVAAHRLLSDSGFNFSGFVEGRDIPGGAVDVVVTNGLLGNILLKYMEGIPSLIEAVIDAESKPAAMAAVRSKFDYERIGGVPLLGVRGVSIVCHGSSTSRAIVAAIAEAQSAAKARLDARIEDFVAHKFDSYFSQVKYLRSFSPSLRFAARFHKGDSEGKRDEG